MNQKVARAQPSERKIRASFANLCLFAFAIFCCPLAAQAQGHAHQATAAATPSVNPGSRDVVVPTVDVNLENLDLREFAQLQTLWKFKTFYDFRFKDQLAATGITFQNLATDDSLRDYKAVHYDHGNGLAAADVDGDGNMDLLFLSQLGGNQLWRGLGGGKFENFTAQAGIALPERICITAAFGDIDNDGDPDLFVTTVRGGNVLFENLGGGKFRDISQAAGVAYVGHSSGAVFFDYDRDGLLDLFVTNVGRYTNDDRGRGGYYVGLRDAFSGHLHPDRTEASILYHNLGGQKFADVSQATGLVDTGWSGDAAVADLNLDGFPDLYVLNMQGDDHYWENQGGKTFVDRTTEVFPRTSWGAMGIKFFDADRDGDADLYVTDMHSDMSREVPPAYEKMKSLTPPGFSSSSIAGNSFFLNQGKGQFEESSNQLNLENYWPWGFSTGDLNADGFEDLFIASSMNFPFRYGVNSLMLNNDGEGFLDAEFITGVEPRAGNPYKVQFELDCSGLDSGHPYCKGKEGRYDIVGSRGTRTSAILDLDGDGDLDIVTGELNDAPMVLVSDLSARKKIHWITIALEGKSSNRDGLGAKVTVRFAGKSSTQWHDGSSGYLSHSLLPLYFGLGDAASIDSIEVFWPSGKRQEIKTGLAINSRLKIQEN